MYKADQYNTTPAMKKKNELAPSRRTNLLHSAYIWFAHEHTHTQKNRNRKTSIDQSIKSQVLWPKKTVLRLE